MATRMFSPYAKQTTPERRLSVPPVREHASGRAPQAGEEHDGLFYVDEQGLIHPADFQAPLMREADILSLNEPLSDETLDVLPDDGLSEINTGSSHTIFSGGISEYRDDSNRLVDGLDRLGHLAGFPGADSPGGSDPVDGNEPGGDGSDTGENGDGGAGPGNGSGSDGGETGSGEGGGNENGSGSGETGNGGDSGDEAADRFEGVARAVLMRAAEGTNDRVIFQLLQLSIDEDGNEIWSPVAIPEEADLSALVSLEEAGDCLDLDSLRVDENGMLSIAVRPEAIQSVQNGGQPPLETVLNITVDGRAYGMQVVIYGLHGQHAYDTANFAAPENGLAYGEWVHGLHGLGGDDTVKTGDGNDTMILDKVVPGGGGNSYIDAGHGDNLIIAGGSCLSGSSTVITGDGNDTLVIEADNYSASNLTIRMGGGDDVLHVRGQIGGTVDMGNGNGTAIIDGDVISNAAITMGDGNDRFQLTGQLAGKVFLGGGNDYALITGNANIGWSNCLDGGAGMDTVNLDSHGGQISLASLGVSMDVGIKGFEVLDLRSASGGEGTANHLVIDSGLKNLQLDSLLDPDLLEGGNTALQTMLTQDATSVLRVMGDANDHVTVNALWQTFLDDMGTQATVSYEGVQYDVFVNHESSWDDNRTEFLLIERGLA